MASSDRNNQGTEVAPSLIQRLVDGFKYIATGQNPTWFGPMDPPKPIAPPDVAGRLFDFPTGVNLHSTPRQDERVDFATLRAAADSYDLLRLTIEIRKDQMAKLTWTIKPKDPKAKSDDRCQKAVDFFQSPDKYHAWEDWLRMLLEDLLVLDAPAIYVRRTRGGDLYALEPMDGSTLKLVIDGYGRRPLPPEPAFVQNLKGVPAVSYNLDEVIYKPRNVRTHKIYGYSPVEQVLMTVQIALRRQLNQLDYYESGTVPDALAGVPESWTLQQLKQFQDYWDALLTGDMAKRRKLRFVPGEIAKNFHETKQPPLKDLYDEWLARIICYAFSLEVTPFVAQVNRSVAETNREQSLAEGLAPLQLWVKSLINGILARHLGAPDLEFVWEEDEALDPEVQSRINVAYVNAGILLADEVRADLGRDPLPPPQEVEEPVLDAEGNPVLGPDGQPLMQTKPKPVGVAAPPPTDDTKKPEDEEEEPPAAKAHNISVVVNLPEIRLPDTIVDIGATTVNATIDGVAKSVEVPRQ